MGFNTAAIFLNDQTHDLPRTDDLGRKLETAILRGDRLNNVPGFHSLPSQHADTAQIVAVGGNRIVALGFGGWRDEPEVLLRKLADQMGYRIVRKPEPKS